MSSFRSRRYEIRGQGTDTNIEHDIEVRGDDDYAHGYLEGFLEALYPSKLWAYDIDYVDLEGTTLVYDVHVWHR